MVARIIEKIRYRLSHTSARRYVNYLRSKGIVIGDNCQFRDLKSVRIDLNRPSLVTIGSHVDMNKNFQILTHDFATGVFRNVFKEFVPSSGRIVIGNNIYFGTDVIVLKGVHIGDNCIIGAGSIVTKNIPASSVAAGRPARVICTLEEYYEKRKKQCIEESFDYARSIIERFHRQPVIEDFWEEFPLFVNGSEVDNYPSLPIRSQLGNEEEYWKKHHTAPFEGFEAFIKAATKDTEKTGESL